MCQRLGLTSCDRAPGHPGAFARESCSGEGRRGATGVGADGDAGEGGGGTHECPAAGRTGRERAARSGSFRTAADACDVHPDPPAEERTERRGEEADQEEARDRERAFGPHRMFAPGRWPCDARCSMFSWIAYRTVVAPKRFGHRPFSSSPKVGRGVPSAERRRRGARPASRFSWRRAVATSTTVPPPTTRMNAGQYASWPSALIAAANAGPVPWRARKIAVWATRRQARTSVANRAAASARARATPVVMTICAILRARPRGTE